MDTNRNLRRIKASMMMSFLIGVEFGLIGVMIIDGIYQQQSIATIIMAACIPFICALWLFHGLLGNWHSFKEEI